MLLHKHAPWYLLHVVFPVVQSVVLKIWLQQWQQLRSCTNKGCMHEYFFRRNAFPFAFSITSFSMSFPCLTQVYTCFSFFATYVFNSASSFLLSPFAKHCEKNSYCSGSTDDIIESGTWYGKTRKSWFLLVFDVS